MPAEWLSGHILDRGDDTREMYSYSLEGRNELRQFLKAIRPEWSFPKKNGKSNVASVMDKLQAVGVTTVWELFRAVMRNTINEDLAQAGYSVLSKETLDRIRKRMSFFRQLDVLTETDCRQTGAFAPVPQLLSQKKLAYWSKAVPSPHDGRKLDERQQSPERTSSIPRATSSQSRRSSRSQHFNSRLLASFGRGEVSVEVDGRELSRPRLRGARTCVRSRGEIEPLMRAEKSDAELGQATDKDSWALKSALRPPSLAKTWQAGDNKGTGSSTLDPGDKPPKSGLLREASQVSISGEESHTLRDSTETRTRLGSGQSGFLFMNQQQRARSTSVDHSNADQETDTLLVTVVKLQQEAAAMQDFRPPSWSVLRRHENALIDNGQAMLDEQEALFERSKLHKLMEQEGLCSPMRRHVAENVRSRLKEESEKVAAEGLEMQHKCTNIRKNLGQMMNARRDLASLRRAIVGRGIDDEQLKQGLLMS